jgi:hypothetical protein
MTAPHTRKGEDKIGALDAEKNNIAVTKSAKNALEALAEEPVKPNTARRSILHLSPPR